MPRTLATAFAAALALTLATAPAWSGSTGLENIHDMRREGKKICFTDHFHYGQSGWMKSKAAATKDAGRSWAEFVYTEYGSDWANYALAASKELTCSPSSGQWQCQTFARPCRRG